MFPKDRRFDEFQWAESSSLNGVVDQLANDIESLEERKQARTCGEAFRFRVAIQVLLLNLFAAWSHD